MFLKHMGFCEPYFKILKPSPWAQTTTEPKPSRELSRKVFVSRTAGPNCNNQYCPNSTHILLTSRFQEPWASTWSMWITAELLRALSRLCFKLPDGKLPHGKLDKPVSAICSVFSSQAVWSSRESSHCCISRSILLWCFSRIFSKPPMRASRHAAAAFGPSISDERLVQAPERRQNSCNSSSSLRLEKGSCGTRRNMAKWELVIYHNTNRSVMWCKNRQNTIARLQSFMDLGIKKYVSSQKLLRNLWVYSKPICQLGRSSSREAEWH